MGTKVISRKGNGRETQIKPQRWLVIRISISITDSESIIFVLAWSNCPREAKKKPIALGHSFSPPWKSIAITRTQHRSWFWSWRYTLSSQHEAIQTPELLEQPDVVTSCVAETSLNSLTVSLPHTRRKEMGVVTASELLALGGSRNGRHGGWRSNLISFIDTIYRKWTLAGATTAHVWYRKKAEL